MESQGVQTPSVKLYKKFHFKFLVFYLSCLVGFEIVQLYGSVIITLFFCVYSEVDGYHMKYVMVTY